MKRKLIERVISFFTALIIIATCNNAFALNAPTLSTSTSGLAVSLLWTTVPGATSYTLYYAPYPYLGEQTIGQTDMGTNTSFSVTLWDGAAYYVAITASSGGDESGYSNVELFVLIELLTPSFLPDTGQAHSYTDRFGEDSDYIINPPSFIINGNGTVTDNVTELMWQREDDNTTYTWYKASGTAHSAENINGATDVCGELTLAGYTDWRLPTVNELMLIADSSKVSPAIDTSAFPNTNGVYWSSTTYAQATTYSSDKSWYVAFDYGRIDQTDRNRLYFVRCVRGKESVSTFSDNGNGSVTDNATSLMWQQGITARYWYEAIRYCEELSLAGYDDWRLPNKNELASIIHYSNYNPAIDEAIFDGYGSSSWSSTTYGASGELGVNFWDNYAWRVWFSYGGGLHKRNKNSEDGVRCVRGGQ